VVAGEEDAAALLKEATESVKTHAELALTKLRSANQEKLAAVRGGKAWGLRL
jgi:hypothetical protein